MAEEIHSLTSQLRFDFTKAIDDIARLQQAIESVDAAFETLSNSVYETEMTIARKINDALRGIKEGTIKVDGRNFNEALANAIGEAFLSRRIQIDLPEENRTFKIALPKDTWNYLRNQIKEALTSSARNVQISTRALRPISISLHMDDMKELRQRFEDQIRKAINSNVKFVLDDKGQESVQPITFTTEDVNKVIRAFQDKLVSALTKKDGIVLGDENYRPKLNIPARVLDQFSMRVSEAFKEVENRLSGDLDKLKNLPNIADKLDELRQAVSNAISYIQQLRESFSNFNLIDNEQDLMLFLKEIEDLRKHILYRAILLVREIKTVMKSAPLSTLDASELAGYMTQIDEAIRDNVRDRIRKAVQQVYQALGFSLIKLDNGEIIAKGIEDIQQRIREATRQAIEELDKGDFRIDVSMVKSTFKQFSEWASKRLDAEVKSALNNLAKYMKESQKQVIEEFAKSVAELVTIRIQQTGLEGRPTVDISIPLQLILPQLQREIQDVVNFLVQHINWERSVQVPDVGQIKIPKYVMREANQRLKQAFREQAKQVIESLKGQKFNLSDEELNAFHKFVQDQSKVLLRHTIRGAKDVMKQFANDILAGRIKGVDPSEIQEIQRQLQESIQSVYNQYVSSLRNVLRLYVTTAGIFDSLSDDLRKDLEEAAALASKAAGSFQLHAVVAEAIAKFYDKFKLALRQNIEAWEPQITPLKPKIDGNRLMRPIHQALKLYLNSVAVSVAAEAERFLSISENIGKNNQAPYNVRNMLKPLNESIMRYVNNYIEGLVNSIQNAQSRMLLDTRTIHGRVLAQWARQLGMRKRDLIRKLPVIDNEKLIKKVMESNIEYIVNKFNNAVQDNIRKQMVAGEQMIKDIEIKPDLEPVHLLARKFYEFQQEVVKKAKEIITEQFNILKEEVQKIKAIPLTLGYNPPASVVKVRAPKTAAVPATVGAPVSIAPSGEYRGGGFSMWFPVPIPNRKFTDPFPEIAPGGDTRSFLGSVINTVRYIVAGMLVGTPYLMYREAWESAKEFDYQLTKAEQNFLIKEVEEAAYRRIVERLGREALEREFSEDRLRQMSYNERQDLIIDRGTRIFTQMPKEEQEEELNQEVRQIRYEARRGAIRPLQNIALAYGLNQHDVGIAYHIASRRFDDPREALAMTTQVAKVRALEEVDVEEAAKGFEAIASQWGLTGFDMNKVANMMIMAANISQVTVEDLLATQQRAGALFRRNLPFNNGGAPMTKEDALAASIALSTMFTQATARSGSEGGTFWKAILERPFTNEGRKILEEYSQRKGFEFLNPWVTLEDGTKVQKNAVQTIAAIIEAARRMDDATQKDFLKTLFPAWHEPSFGAITSLIEDLQKDFERTAKILARIQGKDVKQVNVYEAIDEYIKMIKEADERTVALMTAGMQDTWKFRTQSVKTMWQVATFDVFEQLKDEFSVVATHLTALLRFVRDNADDVANILGLLTKIAASLGMRYVWHLMKGRIDNARQERMARMFDRNQEMLNEEGRLINLRRELVQSQIGERVSVVSDLTQRKLEVQQKIAEIEQQREALLQRASATKEVAAALAAQDVPNDVEAKKEFQRRVEAVQKELEEINQESEKLSKEWEKLKEEEKKLTEQTEKASKEIEDLSRELMQINQEAINLNNRMDALELVMKDLGFDTDRLNTEMQRVSVSVSAGAQILGQYEKEIKELSRQAGLGDDEVKKMREEIEDLTRELRTGKLTLDQYTQKIKRIQELERMRMLQHAGLGNYIPPGGTTATQWGEGLLQAIVGASLFKSMMDLGGRGPIQRLKDVWKTRSIRAFFGKRPILYDRDGNVVWEEVVDGDGKTKRVPKRLELPDNEENVSRFRRVLGKLRPLGRLFTQIRPLGIGLAAIDIGGAVYDALAARKMMDFEKETLQAEKLKELANSVRSFDELSWKNPLKWLYGINMFWDTTIGQINKWLGGTSPGFAELFQALELAKKYDGEKLFEALAGEEGFNFEEMAREARIKEQEYLLKIQNLLDKDGDGRIDESIPQNSMRLSVEDIQTTLNRLERLFNPRLIDVEARRSAETTRLRLMGIREDSKEFQRIMQEYFDESIKILTDYVNELRKARDSLVKGTDAWYEVDMELKQKQMELDQLKLQRQQYKDQELERILNRLREDLEEKEAIWAVRENQAIIGGATEESPEIMKIREARAKDMSMRIEQAQAELRNLLKAYKEGQEQYQQIMRQIMMLEADQTGLLAEIKKHTSKQQTATFNLPDGFRVMTYYEYITRKGTHRNVTVHSGDIHINVTISNMQGNAKDAERVATTIANQVRKIHQQLASQLNNHVGSRVGSTYIGR